ncbi:MAG: YhfC family intramembrane metalloprotease [Chloroflexi bacterium]|nr:YhfC family intramembrane metalloprotease [Chloroflexota bacterium]
MKGLRYFTIITFIFITICIATYLLAAPEAIPPFISAVLMIVLPLGLGIFLAVKLKADWYIYGIGLATFIGSQVAHIPFNQWTLMPYLEGLGLNLAPGSADLAFFGIVLGLSAGIFEETARYIVYRRWLEKARTWKDAMMFGAGHGGMEAMFIGVLALLSFLNFFTLRNANLTAFVPPEEIEATRLAVDAFWNLPWYIQLMPLLERISAMLFHLSAALLVMQAITRRNIAWFFAAILWHTLFNAIAVFASFTWGIVPAETLIFIAGLLSLMIILALREDSEPETLDLSMEPPDGTGMNKPRIPDRPDPITSEKLKDTRYD